MRKTIAALLLTGFMTGTGWAQDRGVWVQVEAQPTLGQAQERVRDYAGRLDDVVGYALGSGWYAIALGPYEEADALALRQSLRSRGAIPSDAFIVDGGQFRQQFWPIGVGAPTTPQPLPGEVDTPDPQDEVASAAPEAAPAPEPEPEPAPEPQETLAEAQASEAALTRPQKEQLQIALRWAGFYNSTIDGLFGRGTRGAMAGWQEANGYDPTGVLTTRQREALLAAYNAVLDGMDIQLVRDSATGIEIEVPLGAVEFAEYAPPFARFEPIDAEELPARVLLISQEGDQDRLFGLYEIMQILEIVPPVGPRERGSSSFEIEGVDGEIHTYVTASLEDGVIKGWALVWPSGDEERRTRILNLMRASYRTLPGALDPAIAPPDEDQSIDLVSGLAIRQPERIRSGFYVDARGAVVTTADAVDGCREVTIDGAHDATVIYEDADLGLAVIRPEDPLAPLSVASFQTGVPRLQAEVAVAGFPYGAALAAPAVTFGTLADIRGLDGDEDIKRLDIATTEGDAGGPVFDDGGAVLGMLLPRDDADGQVLPGDVAFSVDAEALTAALREAGVAPSTTDRIAALPPETLSRRAAQIAVMVSCWE